MRYRIIKHIIRRKRKITVRKALLLLLLVVAGFVLYCMYFSPAYPRNRNMANVQRVTVNENFYTAGDSWLLKNRYGLWEMYASGNAIDRGNKIGVLSKELIVRQEDIFVDYLRNIIPSKFMMHFLRIGVGIYNRNLGRYIPEENREEIYAISRYASTEYSWIGNNYQRIMNYHSAHDIGHAVQLMGFAGCSALAVWGDKTQDGNLLIGRNFDFHVNDEFAKDKILLFVNPVNGYRHAFVTWGGMIGVVSGMNERGLCVLVNAAPSDIPFSSATPVTILARRILQYARNIDEAISFAENAKTFISEQFIIASAEDNRVVSIEKTKDGQAVYSSSTKPYMLCTNHFQSEKFSAKENGAKNSSTSRMERMLELADSIQTFTPQKMVNFLRDKKGRNGTNIGLGNESSINQLIAHHSVVFHPYSKTIWVSTAPYQEGAFLAYNLNDVFNNAVSPRAGGFSIERLFIPANRQFIDIEMGSYNFYRYSINTPVESFSRDINLFINSNPENYMTYEYLGDYYSYNGNTEQAQKYYGLSLQKIIPDENEHSKILEKLDNLKKE
ncbi:MAG: C45 family peptidase [Prevotellaceae bacterium]|jgi:predicted choloylglycine hydrolase|nr:C45 family peptidase [Prevotellaceae bacterium]